MPELSGLTTNFFPTADEIYTGTLTGTISGGAATVGLTNLSRYANGEVVTLTVAPGNNEMQRTFTGVVDTGLNQLTNVVWTEDPYSYDTGQYNTGTTVKDWRSATHAAQTAKGIRQQHAQDGTHTNITAISFTTSGNGSVGGTFGVTGATTLTGGATVGNTVAQFKDQSSNTVDIDPVRRNEGFQGFDYIQTGLNPSSATGLTVTIPAGTYYIAGKRYTYAGGTKALGASKDCYLDIDTAGTITSVEVANGATSGMTLTANSVRFAKIVTGGASVSSYTLSGWDSIGNRIYRNDPLERTLGIAERTTNYSMTTSDVEIMALTFIVPTGGRLVEIDAVPGQTTNVDSNEFITLRLWEGAVTSGTKRQETGVGGSTGNDLKAQPFLPAKKFLAAGTYTYRLSGLAAGTAASSLVAAADDPMILSAKMG